jgi:hypothetical protein
MVLDDPSGRLFLGCFVHLRDTDAIPSPDLR